MALPLPRWMVFAAVGAAAAAVHFLAVLLLVEFSGLPPQPANVLAFLIAFWVSYAGHSCLTFAAAGARRAQSLPRFFLVAVSSFAGNAALFALLLRFGWDYRTALFTVLLIVAVLTYLASRLWAFRGAAK
ncbi:MAG: GtrA family protein [Candidatus Protistobacter heckmanni]|nr:GtrA family protein [Candidatus Protistobacter heckmanni]